MNSFELATNGCFLIFIARGFALLCSFDVSGVVTCRSSALQLSRATLLSCGYGVMPNSCGRWLYGLLLTLLTALLWGVLPVKLKEVLQVMNLLTVPCWRPDGRSMSGPSRSIG
jgi:hypothetical protein